VTCRMVQLSLDSLDYRILFVTEAIVESSNDSITTVFARNCVAHCGNCISVTHLSTSPLIKTIMIPYSGHTIFPSDPIFQLVSDSLVIEFGSELHCLAPLPFPESRLTAVFLPQSIRFVSYSAFSRCSSLSCVYFDSHSSIWQLGSFAFSNLDCLTEITIPASLRQIHKSAFEHCHSLRSVTFESPSECWYMLLLGHFAIVNF
jgi:hypothetical protein